MRKTPNSIAASLLELVDELLGFPAELELDEVRLDLPPFLMKPTSVGEDRLHGDVLSLFVATPYSAIDLTLVLGPTSSFANPSVTRRPDGERDHELVVSSIVLDNRTARRFVKRVLAIYCPDFLSITTR